MHVASAANAVFTYAASCPPARSRSHTSVTSSCLPGSRSIHARHLIILKDTEVFKRQSLSRFQRKLPRPNLGPLYSGDGEEDDDLMEVDIKVEGMVCGGCSGNVAKALEKVEKVEKVEVNLETGVASVWLNVETMGDALEALPSLVGAVTDAGFDAEPVF
ncbi:hypothetical protein CYMTET_26931 [Cymbomonas tetramitiformis]|uniref:HMA domain-containing protein n=1 Tax=Cymbomonas tetramitiformis TaxID=36881 RepID=A0AAE0FQR6_9CHLO|nr:hypothetical protein CYMTET_26931 [Cymbomonas tetramitiformis]